MTFTIKLYLVCLAVFFLIDMLWLGLLARNFYQQQLGFLLNPRTNWLAAVIFYLIFVAGVVVFVVLPGAQTGSLARTLILGAFFGLVTYATYDLTNLATLKGWPITMVVVDIGWGMTLSTLVSLAGFWAVRWLR